MCFLGFLCKSFFTVTFETDNINEELTSEQGEESGKKRNRVKKKKLLPDEPAVGKRCWRLHGVDTI